MRQAATAQFERAATAGRRGRARWRSPRWAPPSCSPSTPITERRASSLTDAAASIAAPSDDAAWPWPEPRLTYANAVLPEAMIAAGRRARPTRHCCQHGLDLLGWLLDHETADGHLSVTPVGGVDPATTGPAFDQQPIEVVDTGRRLRAGRRCRSDATWPGASPPRPPGSTATTTRAAMWDPQTGGGFDGLHADGVNLNQGAESTLALLSTQQHATRLSRRRRSDVAHNDVGHPQRPAAHTPTRPG